MILGRPAHAQLLRRQQRGDLLPLRIGQFVASHPTHMEAITPPVNPLQRRPSSARSTLEAVPAARDVGPLIRR